MTSYETVFMDKDGKFQNLFLYDHQSVPERDLQSAGAGYCYRRKDGNDQRGRKLPDPSLQGHLRESLYFRNSPFFGQGVLYTEMTELLNVIN